MELGEVLQGEDCLFDAGAVVGYLSPRKAAGRRLILGRGARVRSGSVIYAGSTIGEGLETGHNVILREQNRIGDRFQIWNNSVVDYGCVIGDRVKVHCNIYIAQFTVLEDDVFLAPGVTIANDIHPGCPDSGRCMRGPTLKRGAQIGVNVTIVPYVTIGARSLIGSGSVVTKDIPDGVVAYGNPARVRGPIEELRCTTEIRDRPYS